MNNRAMAFVLTVLLLCSPVVRGEIYKCTDAQGGVRYADEPCAGASTVITPKAAPSIDENSAARREKTRRLLRAYEEEHAEERRKRAEQQAEEERRERNCISARSRLQQYTQASRLYRLDEEGNHVDLSDEERRRVTENARAEVARWCG